MYANPRMIYKQWPSMFRIQGPQGPALGYFVGRNVKRGYLVEQTYDEYWESNYEEPYWWDRHWVWEGIYLPTPGTKYRDYTISSLPTHKTKKGEVYFGELNFSKGLKYETVTEGYAIWHFYADIHAKFEFASVSADPWTRIPAREVENISYRRFYRRIYSLPAEYQHLLSEVEIEEQYTFSPYKIDIEEME